MVLSKPAAALRKSFSAVKAQHDAKQNTLELQQAWLLAIGTRRDQSAFQALDAYYRPRLIAFYANKQMPVAQAEDLVQEVLLTLWQKASQYDPAKAKPAAWIYQIARNKRLDYLRSPGAQIHQPLNDNLPVFATDNAAEIMEANLHQRALDHLNLLPPEQSQLVEAAFVAEKTHAQLAKSSGLPLGTVKSRLRLALARLRQLLAT